jgi:hypothetical protein
VECQLERLSNKYQRKIFIVQFLFEWLAINTDKKKKRNDLHELDQ